MIHSIAYDLQELNFELPEGMRAKVAGLNPAPPVADVTHALSKSLQSPLAAAPLRELARPGDRVCLAITDASRPCPTLLLLPPVLAELKHAGIRDTDISIIVATGLHRPSTREEKEALVGADTIKRYRVIDHCATFKKQLQALGQTETGVPIAINKLAYEADILLSIGLVELHQYAGYSGGGKTVAIGLAGETTISHTHSLAMLKQAGVRIDNICQNPFRQALEEIAEKAGLRFIVNVILDQKQRITHLATGNSKAVFETLVDKARQMSTVSIDHPYKMIIAGVGAPKDANIYQLSRAASYLVFKAKPAVAKGGIIILAAKATEGIGGGLAEQGFFKLMSQASDPDKIISGLEKGDLSPPSPPSQPGAQRAYVMAQVLKHCRVLVVGSCCPELVKQVGFIPAQNMTEALGLAKGLLGSSDEVLIVPHGTQTLINVL